MDDELSLTAMHTKNQKTEAVTRCAGDNGTKTRGKIEERQTQSRKENKAAEQRAGVKDTDLLD